MAKTNRHGAHQEIHYGEFSLNEIGLVTGSVQRHLADETFDAPRLERLLEPPAVGLPFVGAKRNFDEERQLAIYTYSYQGHTSSFDFANDAFATFEFDDAMAEDPIETHPKFGSIKTKYGWIPSKRQFPELAPSGGSGSSGIQDPGVPGISKLNDLHGTDSYYAFAGVFSKTYIRATIPVNLLKGVGAIGTPTGTAAFSFPNAGGKRNWLKLMPRVRKKGNSVQITERWLLSGPRGWNKDVYAAGQLESDFESAANVGF